MCYPKNLIYNEIKLTLNIFLILFLLKIRAKTIKNAEMRESILIYASILKNYAIFRNSLNSNYIFL